MSKPLYTAVVLDLGSHLKLLDWFPEELLKKVIAHHMTIRFKPDQDHLDDLAYKKLLGTTQALWIIGYACSETIQTVAVLPGSDHCLWFGPEIIANPVPHITVSTDGKTSPKFSNDLLGNRFTKVNGPILTGTVTAVMPNQPKEKP